MVQYHETTGYIIHTRPFKNTSLILEVFSHDFGKIQLIAKGIKNNKKYKSQIQYFNRLKIQFFGNSNLKTLCTINVLSNYKITSLLNKMAAIYLNELIHLSVLEGEVALNLFKSYESSLHKLGKIKLSIILRRFELQLLKNNGFELSLSNDCNLNDWLTIDKNQGLIITSQESAKLCKVSDFCDFIAGKDLTKKQVPYVNKLMLSAIDLNVSYRKVYSREALKNLVLK